MIDYAKDRDNWTELCTENQIDLLAYIAILNKIR